ncbi:MAG: hypothetical protein ACQER7_06930, partial [Bacteroidota bacterium]
MAINISYAQENVFYLEQVPVIDGHKPPFIQDDHLRIFENVHKSDDELPGFEAEYFLGYTAHHFYIYIEYDADTIVARDR